ncbi:MAG: hypothetical protein AAGI30_08760 [Planctomycetota bacterium]
MVEWELLAPLAQFGAAGVVAWMWLSERRASMTREHQLTESHRALMEQRVHLDAIMKLLQENTRAFAAIESGHRLLIDALERLRTSTPEGDDT